MIDPSRKTVVVVGATGLFGGHLARHLIGQSHFDIVAAGRDASKLVAFSAAHGGRAFAFDRTEIGDVNAMLTTLRPFAVIDAAGPFQDYGDDPYAFARAVISAGAHYLDIADAAEFACDFAVLDDLAKSQGVVALSGASSTPAISSAVADTLAQTFQSIESIDVAIVPGNRTPRGLSVMRAILSQVGKPMLVWRHGVWAGARGWSDTRRFTLAVGGMPPVRRRLASLVETPDSKLFPSRYRARSVTFRAGLEVPLFHHALSVWGRVVGAGLISRPERLASVLLRVAGFFEHWGSAVGGMTVRIMGKAQNGQWQQATWDLIAPDGHGPKIPTLPVIALLDKMARGGVVTPGARACVGELTLEELTELMAPHGIKTEASVVALATIFEQALGADFAEMAPALQDFHRGFGRREFVGTARVAGAQGWIARIAARVAGFPPAQEQCPVRVVVESTESGEKWTRTFGAHTFSSLLTFNAKSKRAVESFGPLHFTLGLNVANGDLRYPVERARVFGWLPLPSVLLPRSTTREFADADGAFNFDVLIELPSGQRVAHYQGRLREIDPR